MSCITIIIRSYEGGIPTFYSELSKTIESDNPLQQYKSILTLHKVLREGNKPFLLITGLLGFPSAIHF